MSFSQARHVYVEVYTCIIFAHMLIGLCTRGNAHRKTSTFQGSLCL